MDTNIEKNKGKNSTGEGSTGNYSTGDYSLGNHSTGDYSLGNHSTGEYSTGDYSTGWWSISNYSTGHFSTEDYSGFGCFDKPCTLEEFEDAYIPMFLFCQLAVWVEEVDMSDEEKKNNPQYKSLGGYNKRVTDPKEAYRDSWEDSDEYERSLVRDLPNFCPKKFKEITGIDVDEELGNTN